jgi:hypothetical protein
MGLPKLTKQHGNKLIPTTETLGASLSLGIIYSFKELALRK